MEEAYFLKKKTVNSFIGVWMPTGNFQSNQSKGEESLNKVYVIQTENK